VKSNKTKKVAKINDKMLIATVDIGKNVQHGYFRAPNGSDIKPFAFYNSKKSFRKFWQKLCQFKNKQGLEQIVIGFESTGPYAEPLFHYLKKSRLSWFKSIRCIPKGLKSLRVILRIRATKKILV
jgi:hypothetical protein